MNWKRGLNFSQTKYKLINKRKFIPHVRPNLRIAIPRQILEIFNANPKEIILIKIKSNKNKESIRIKKLFLEGNSYTISFKAEKLFRKPVVEVIDIKSEREALSRKTNDFFSLNNFIPKFTFSNKGATPIYVFNINSKLIAGGYYKKDIIIKNRINFDDSFLSALGLYFAEGGKTAASFTNSWPQAINHILNLFEDMFGLERKKIKASICCNSSLKNKQKQLKKFWEVETGMLNFSKGLHFNKNSMSPQGILELYFCSEVIKSILVNIINKILDRKSDSISLLRGIFSGDASPILQNKYCITHNLAFNNKEKKFYLNLLAKMFPNTKINIIQGRFVVYSSWEENRKLLLNDIYRFNPLNKAKFAKQFFSLPKTKKSMLNDAELQNFKMEEYPKVISEILNTYRKLVELRVQNDDFIKEKEKEWTI